MENLPIEKLLLTLVVPCVFLIAWFVRLEMRVYYSQQNFEESKKDRAKIWLALDAHKEKPDIHFNRDVTRQVDEKNDMRFKKIEGELQEIKSDVKQLLRKN